jgi:ankyrin repeat protein
VKLLIKRDDIKVNSKDNYGWTPLSRALDHGHEVVVTLSVERDVKIDSKQAKFTVIQHRHNAVSR